MKKVGILGGTFNPIHTAHIVLAQTAYYRLNLDKVLIMPSNNPPHKDNSDIADDAARADMIKLAIKDYNYLEYSDFELNREGTTYTSDTLTALNQKYPDTRFYFIIGGDSVMYFDAWHEPLTILKNCALVCTGRSGLNSENVIDYIEKLRDKFTLEAEAFIPEIYYLNTPAMDISSNMIRKYVSFEMSSEAFLSPFVSKYICEHVLYQNRQYEAIKADLQGKLKPKRYSHVLNVAQTAVSMAYNFGFDIQKAYLAGLLHDCAKYFSDEDMVRFSLENNIELEEIELKSVQLIHPKLGAVFAQKLYGIEDEDILNAIKYHTTGRPGMSMLEKIIYLSDLIEPSRTWGEDDKELNIIRSVSYTDIDKAMYLSLAHTCEYLLTVYDESQISPATLKTYNYYKELYFNRS